jgi:hypothetical protein
MAQSVLEKRNDQEHTKSKCRQPSFDRAKNVTLHVNPLASSASAFYTRSGDWPSRLATNRRQ